MWKHLIGYATAALFGSALGIVGAATLPLLNPQQLQVPANGADLNAIINSVNSGTMGMGPGGGAGGPNLVSGAFTISTSVSGGGTNVNGVQASGSSTGIAPGLQAVGSDANVNLSLSTQGNGLVQFASAQSWIKAPTLATCPGYSAAALGGGANASRVLGPNYLMTGYLMLLDNNGIAHAVPTC